MYDGNSHGKRITSLCMLVRCPMLFLLSLVLLAVACQSTPDEHGPGAVTATIQPRPTQAVDHTAIFTVTVAGSELFSSTTERIAQKFTSQYPDVSVLVELRGTSHGFERLCRGEVHMNLASLEPQNIDYELCAQSNIEWLELPVGRAGFGFFASQQNDFLACLTVEQVRRIWAATDAPRIWSALDAQWPDGEIHRYAQLDNRGRPVAILEDPSYEEIERLDHFEMSIVDSLAADPFGIGLFSTVYYAGNQDRIRPISLDEGEGCTQVVPSTAEPGWQPFWGQDFIIYVNRQAIREHPPVKAFLDFYMTEALTLTRRAGFFPLSPEEYEGNRLSIRTERTAP